MARLGPQQERAPVVGHHVFGQAVSRQITLFPVCTLTESKIYIVGAAEMFQSLGNIRKVAFLMT